MPADLAAAAAADSELGAAAVSELGAAAPAAAAAADSAPLFATDEELTWKDLQEEVEDALLGNLRDSVTAARRVGDTETAEVLNTRLATKLTHRA